MQTAMFLLDKTAGRRWSTALAAGGIAWLAATFPAHCAELDLLDRPYAYVLIDQDARGALREFGRNLGIPVDISDSVRGQVRGEIKAKTAGEFLRELAAANGLVWYFDGSVLHVNSSEEFTTQIIDAGRASGARVLDEMQRLRLTDPRFSIYFTPHSSALRVSGPPSYIAMVRQVVSTVQPPPQTQADDPRVRVFRGGRRDEIVTSHPTLAAEMEPQNQLSDKINQQR
ncbi:type III secretion protein [Phyllobacterium salinisoli]|uniref:type III secretion protein n=1 Tax=Phyllobacterium salinisoli TaxID=1899321 RepID=UPI0011C05FE9|nr:type III secretion protein [Phyllobacterium salinisoli]